MKNLSILVILSFISLIEAARIPTKNSSKPEPCTQNGIVEIEHQLLKKQIADTKRLRGAQKLIDFLNQRLTNDTELNNLFNSQRPTTAQIQQAMKLIEQTKNNKLCDLPCQVAQQYRENILNAFRTIAQK